MEIIRGDTKGVTFKRTKKEDGSEIKGLPDKLYFTVKKNYNSSEALIQKTLSDGTITYNEEDNTFHFVIKPEDTESLSYGDYVYDIERIIGSDVKTIANDILTINEEVTHKNNEV